jgi:hypothetical protein
VEIKGRRTPKIREFFMWLASDGKCVKTPARRGGDPSRWAMIPLSLMNIDVVL